MVKDEDNGIIGFSSFGQCRDEDAFSKCGEINSIYLLPEFWGRGFGGALLSRSLSDLISQNFTECVIWVLKGNVRAIRFYQHFRFRFDGNTKSRRIEGFELMEKRMIRDL
ncbi:GNAT family N-acetyltransferase [bacterium]|nr:GNAT family N-acetyltransferase [bacterium]